MSVFLHSTTSTFSSINETSSSCSATDKGGILFNFDTSQIFFAMFLLSLMSAVYGEFVMWAFYHVALDARMSANSGLHIVTLEPPILIQTLWFHTTFICICLSGQNIAAQIEEVYSVRLKHMYFSKTGHVTRRQTFLGTITHGNSSFCAVHNSNLFSISSYLWLYTSQMIPLWKERPKHKRCIPNLTVAKLVLSSCLAKPKQRQSKAELKVRAVHTGPRPVCY